MEGVNALPLLAGHGAAGYPIRLCATLFYKRCSYMHTCIASSRATSRASRS